MLRSLFLSALWGFGVAVQVAFGDETKSASDAIFKDDFQNGSERWETTDAASWEVYDHDGNKTFGNNKRTSDYQPKVRSPHNIALMRDVKVGSFQLTFKVRSTKDTGGHRDCCIFWGY
ncbi:MAG: hypothetical protein JNK90_15735, partial [Planctomycetaceae bacterium]|nr:hypothetical protein [Planctomycetaceae bacterium]